MTKKRELTPKELEQQAIAVQPPAATAQQGQSF